MSQALFSCLDHPSFPAWLKEGLDGIFASDQRFNQVDFHFWVSGGDKCDVEFLGGVDFQFVKGSVEVSQDELDHIPQVRMIERRTREMWRNLPLSHSIEDGNAVVDCDYGMHARREGEILFWSQSLVGIEQHFLIGAKWVEAEWICNDRIIIPDYDGPKTDLMIGKGRRVLERYDPKDLDLKTIPDTLSFTVEGNDLVFETRAGDISRCMTMPDV